MNKVLMAFIIFLTVSSCGIPLPLQKDLIVKDIDAVRQFATTDPVFASFVQEFELKGRVILNDGSFKIGDIPINFGDTENPKFQGVCFEYPDGTKEIIVRREWWAAVDDTYRESLIFHELGHCRLGRDHYNAVITTVEQGDFKASMMNEVIVSPQNYEDFKDEYRTELYTQSQDEFKTALTALGLRLVE